MLVLILILILLFGGGGFYGYRSGYYGGRGLSLSGVVVICLFVWMLMGR